MRPPRDRDAASARPPEQQHRQRLGQEPRPWRAAEGPPAREAPVAAARTRSPEPRKKNHLAAEGPPAPEVPVAAARTRPSEPRKNHLAAAEGPPAREPLVAALSRPPDQPHGAPEGRTAHESPVAPVARPPAPEDREPPVARPPEPRPGPYYAPVGHAGPAAATTHGPPPPPEPPREPWPYPPYYYIEPEPARRRRRTSALASCLAAAAFLLLAGGIAATALFLLFRPHPPDIAVAAVRLPSFAAANGTVAFTFEQLATVRNPNRAPLSHYDSSLRVAYAGGELGSVYIPAGLIDGGGSKRMSASFAVQAFPAAVPPPLEMAAQQPAAAAVVMEVDSLLVVKGRVTMLRVLTHRVQAAKLCRVGVSPVDGRVLGFRC
ncbi:hypothetical protein BRADI_2g08000v3 [Brachypodium distachyon]|uniref:Uncharacterized protein n=2 Tax=Brachypodium distachyon TaxID=15368 RepID=A0A0Q3FVQ2_BRADI|nr:hypothetical protein BRADI_2g08000v3 [Brachypodium distachyon]